MNYQSKKTIFQAFCTLGVVFGDIGTSPLYAFKSILYLSNYSRSPVVIFGMFSLIVWTLIIVVSLKYALCVMRVDNHGEGGILALMSLLQEHKCAKLFIINLALLGGALLYGDGVITPAISVLAAIEGVKIVVPDFAPYVLPVSLIILFVLFFVQHFGVSKISVFFSPVMFIWFITILWLGIRGIYHYPSILLSLNPYYAIHFMYNNIKMSFFILGGVFLCVTGAEALYADMGNYSRQSIRISWFGVVFPCLLINYAGQAALVLAGAEPSQNIFYLLCPSFLMPPVIIMATLATIIASQAIISGIFTLTHQAIQLGWLPNLRIKQTSCNNNRQIYIGSINNILMINTLILAIIFKTSEGLAAAYGIAVSLTMFITSILLFNVMLKIWGWSVFRSAVFFLCFLIMDTLFLISNLLRVLNGGYLPLFISFVIFIIMKTWHHGEQYICKTNKNVTLEEVIRYINDNNIPRTSGTAVFFSNKKNEIPYAVNLHIQRNRVLQENIIILSVITENKPFINMDKKVIVKKLTPCFLYCTIHYGFMECTNIPAVIMSNNIIHDLLPANQLTYYVSYDALIAIKNDSCFPYWQQKIFKALKHNSAHTTDYYKLPYNQVVELNRILPL
ncbi:KUP/HAK/KT family potassium transporter (plasmid) [Escherichia albertii]|uniref:potassium transporter Kup n=1 Tax=Escherichia albertii TaxID=208962 RepID=UPI0023628A41|nr:KUP/HAK/KT family potassium transporter [Escherichia albertii]WDB54707.1 KUP/HAK/KT family potassium transporter [Escherichia albertii]